MNSKLSKNYLGLDFCSWSEDVQLSLKFKKILYNSYLLYVFGGKRYTVFLLFLLETSLGHWKSIELAVDETVSVCITEVVSPDLFYAVPVQTKGKKKCSLFLISVRSHCCKLVNRTNAYSNWTVWKCCLDSRKMRRNAKGGNRGA